MAGDKTYMVTEDVEELLASAMLVFLDKMGVEVKEYHGLTLLAEQVGEDKLVIALAPTFRNDRYEYSFIITIELVKTLKPGVYR